jgi:hypothetical protein
MNPYAPASALVLLSAAILVQVALINSPLRSGGYLISAGFFAALAAVIDPAAIVFTILLTAVILCIRWRWSVRIGGVLMYCVGILPPLLLHLSLSYPIIGNWSLGLSHIPTKRVPLAVVKPTRVTVPPAAVNENRFDEDDNAVVIPTAWQMSWVYMGPVMSALFGNHGVLSHFPVMILGMAGVLSVMHRHWPASTKSLAVATAAGAMIILLRYAWLPVDWRWAMFGARWYVVFLPFLLFWAGAWLRRTHHPATWSIAGVLFFFSAGVTLIGATDPMPREGYDRYTAAAALHNLTTAGASDELPVIAGR